MTSDGTSLPHKLLGPPPGFPANLIFRLAGSEDLPALYSACFADRSPEAFQRTMATVLHRQAAGRSFLLLATRSQPGQIIGSAQLHLHRQRGEIADLIVASHNRKQGIGTALMTIIVNVGYYLGLDYLEIGVENDNIPAVHLYQRFGFTKERSIKVPGQGLATIMVRELNQP